MYSIYPIVNYLNTVRSDIIAKANCASFLMSLALLAGCSILSEETLIGPIESKLVSIDIRNGANSYESNYDTLHYTQVEMKKDTFKVIWQGADVIVSSTKIETSDFVIREGRISEIYHYNKRGSIDRRTSFVYDGHGNLVERHGQFLNGNAFSDNFSYTANNPVPVSIVRNQKINDNEQIIRLDLTDSGHYVGSVPFDPSFPKYDFNITNPNFINGLSFFIREWHDRDSYMITKKQNRMIGGRLYTIMMELETTFKINSFQQMGEVHSKVDISLKSDLIGILDSLDVRITRTRFNEGLVFSKYTSLKPILEVLDGVFEQDYVILNKYNTLINCLGASYFGCAPVGWFLQFNYEYSEI